MQPIKIVISLCVVSLLLFSCSNTRHLPAGDSLFIGSRVHINDKEAPRRERKVLQGDLKGAVRPKPNSKLLGIRLKLTVYNIGGGDSGRKVFKWLRNLGEPPVLASSFKQDKNRQILADILENRGYFYPTVTGETKTKRRKTVATFDVTTGPQYTIRKVVVVQDSTRLAKDIDSLMPNTLLKADAPYNLDLIKGERDRIDKNLKEKGYYRYKSDYLLAQIDSTAGSHKVDIFLRLKDDMPDDARNIYYINNVYIYTNYRLNSGGKKIDTTDKNNDTLFYKRYYIVGNTKKYRPMIFTQAMQFEPGEVYNRTDQNISLNRLVNMGVFKFVKNDFVPVGETDLNAFYYLTPYPKKSLRLELGAMTKNDSRVGSMISLSWRNRNTFRGAELLTIKASVGFELQSGGNTAQPGTYEFSLQPSITLPRFAIPFFHPQSSSIFVPHTVIRTGYDIQLRSNLYDLQSISAGYGFTWKENVKNEHQLFPFNITYVKADTLRHDTTFNINYSNLLFNGVIFGPTYEYTYNTRGNGPPHHDDFYFDGLLDLSANIYGIAQGANVKSYYDKPKEIFGTPYAQYIKAQTDLRYYMNYASNPNSIWASRLIIGLGYPYGNSWGLPNVKQFFSGGNSSLRGFPSRLVGPGTYNEEYLTGKQTYLETFGDIKLEINTEIRAQLYQFVHGALFIDAGNVWTYREDPRFPGGAFTSKFLSQLAVDVGAGLRFDFKILVLRLDAGFPIRKPWLTTDSGAPSSNFTFDSTPVFNIGIGYPF